jgi:hypothetical protein
MNRKEWRNNNKKTAIYFCPTCKSGKEECKCIQINPGYVGNTWSMDIVESSQVSNGGVAYPGGETISIAEAARRLRRQEARRRERRSRENVSEAQGIIAYSGNSIF